MSTAAGSVGVSAAAASFALHSVLLQSNPNRSRVSGYTDKQNILLVGEGDFSWALSLAVTLGGKRITATCYDSQRTLFTKYNSALDNVTTLKSLGATVVYGVDATALEANAELYSLPPHAPRNARPKLRRFHRVVFNFPHAGGGSTRADVAVNQQLLRDFFASAGRVIRRNGEVHVSLRRSPFYQSWKIKEQAEAAGLAFLRAKPFDAEQFTGYKPQRTEPAVRETPDTVGAVTYHFGLPTSGVSAAAHTATQRTRKAKRKAGPPVTDSPAAAGKGKARKQKRARNGSARGDVAGSSEVSSVAHAGRPHVKAKRRAELAEHASEVASEHQSDTKASGAVTVRSNAVHVPAKRRIHSDKATRRTSMPVASKAVDVADARDRGAAPAEGGAGSGAAPPSSSRTSGARGAAAAATAEAKAVREARRKRKKAKRRERAAAALW